MRRERFTCKPYRAISDFCMVSLRIYYSFYIYFLNIVSGSVRLVDGEDGSNGNVEVMNNGTWGSVCDHSWDIADARVACRSLGFEDVVNATHSAAFGQGTGPIWLSNLHCNGNESGLLECPHDGVGNNNCTHADDAGALCTPTGN